MSDPEEQTRSAKTKARIVQAATGLFAELGFERTTVRLVAQAAQIHPSMVMRYFGSKEALFIASVSFDLRLPNLASTARKQIGQVLVRHFLSRWEESAGNNDLPALLRIALTHPAGKERLAAIFEEQLVPALQRFLSAKQARQRAALIATQTLGLALTRYVLQLPAVVALSPEEIIEEIGTTIQHFLK